MLAQGGVTGAADPIVYGLSSGGYGDWKCCSQLPHSCYEGLPQACGGKYSGTVSKQPPSACILQKPRRSETMVGLAMIADCSFCGL